MLRLLKYSLVLCVLLGILCILLLSSNLYTYHRLGHETLIAELYFEPMSDRPGDNLWLAHVSTGKRCYTETYPLQGDQWRIDAAFVKWKNWANLLGLDALYRLERLEGRYEDVEQQKTHMPSVHPLSEAQSLELTEVAALLGQFNVFMDSSYGSSVYQTIEPQQTWYIYSTQSGLITRSKPRNPELAVHDMLTIQINRACGEPPGYYQQVVDWLNGQLHHWL